MRQGSMKALFVGLAMGLVIGVAVLVPLQMIGVREPIVLQVIGGIIGIKSMMWSCDRYMR